MSNRNLDVSRLPDYAFGSRTLLAWGTWGFIVIEGCIFAVLGITILYGMSRADEWPPPPWPAPPLSYALLSSALIFAAIIPNHLCKRAAERFAPRATRVWLALGALCGLGVLVCRAFEFPALPVRWDDNFYGSILWTTLAFHTLHVLSNVIEDLVLLALMFRRGVKPHRFSDVADSAFYAYFAALAWLPLFHLLYLHPRLG